MNIMLLRFANSIFSSFSCILVRLPASPASFTPQISSHLSPQPHFLKHLHRHPPSPSLPFISSTSLLPSVPASACLIFSGVLTRLSASLFFLSHPRCVLYSPLSPHLPPPHSLLTLLPSSSPTRPASLPHPGFLSSLIVIFFLFLCFPSKSRGYFSGSLPLF